MRLYVLLVCCVLAACGPREASLAPLQNIALERDKTYVVVAKPISELVNVDYLLCEPSQFGRYTVEVLRLGNVVRCAKPALGTVRASGAGVGSTHYTLQNGVKVSIRELRTGSLVEPRELGSDPVYLAASINRLEQKVTVNSGQVPLYQIEPGTIHFLGFSFGYGKVTWEDPGNISEELAKSLPEWARDRVVVQRPEFARVSCSFGSNSEKCKATLPDTAK